MFQVSNPAWRKLEPRSVLETWPPLQFSGTIDQAALPNFSLELELWVKTDLFLPDGETCSSRRAPLNWPQTFPLELWQRTVVRQRKGTHVQSLRRKVGELCYSRLEIAGGGPLKLTRWRSCGHLGAEKNCPTCPALGGHPGERVQTCSL